MQFPLHNISHEKIQKYMLVLFFHDLCLNIFVVVFVNQTGIDFFLITRDSVIPINIYIYSFCAMIYNSNILGKFTCKQCMNVF